MVELGCGRGSGAGLPDDRIVRVWPVGVEGILCGEGGAVLRIDVRSHVVQVGGDAGRYFADALAFLVVGIGLGGGAFDCLGLAIQRVVGQGRDGAAAAGAVRSGAGHRAAFAFLGEAAVGVVYVGVE